MENLIGKKFGMLTVIERGQNTKRGKATWICKCDCGKIKSKSVCGYDLKKGKVRSCGCYYKISNKEINKRHGMTESRIYNIWAGMKGRCKRVNRYVKNNISVCEEWNVFENFCKWAYTHGYNEKLTIDRIDNKKGYNPENCRWVNYKVQERNRTNNRYITINGETHILAEWAEILNINSATLANRIKSGWSEDELFMTPNLANAKFRRERNGC